MVNSLLLRVPNLPTPPPPLNNLNSAPRPGYELDPGLGALFWRQKSDLRDLYSGFAPWGPCFGPKSPISGFCIRGLPHRGHVFGPKSPIFGFCIRGLPPGGHVFGPQSPIFGFCIRDLLPGGHVFAPKVRFPGFVFGVCPIGAMYSPRLAGWPAGISGRNFEFFCSSEMA